MDAPVSIETRSRPSTVKEQRERLERRKGAPGGVLSALNEWTFTGEQMRGSIEAIKHVQIHDMADFHEHSRLLALFCREQGIGSSDFAAAALHGRVVAMEKWCHRYDPHGQTDIAAFFEAAGRQPLISTNEGIGFEPVSFGELIAFITELPF